MCICVDGYFFVVVFLLKQKAASELDVKLNFVSSPQ